jgi:glycosyltransferase involved in cell wall biosynthesis
MKKKISIIFSFYNEEKNISISVKRITQVLKKIKNLDYELIYVNDCSTDDSSKELIKERKKNKKVKIINLSRRFGHMPGIMAGLKNCSGDAAIYLDIDLQDPPAIIEKMISSWINENYDVIFTTRIKRQGSFFMNCLSKIGYYILEKTTYINVAKDSGDFRLISRRVINEYTKFNEINPFFRFLTDFIGFKKKQIFYEREKRIVGKSNFNLYQIFYQFFEISLMPFSNFPLRFSLIFGFFAFFVCFVILSRTLYLYFSGVSDISTLSIFVAILIFGSIQSLIIGLLSIYIGSIYMESKKRPIYIIDEKIGFKKF